MLVLSRETEEGILIDEHILIVVKKIKYPTVRIGIQAPPEVSIHRAEVAERIFASGGKLADKPAQIERTCNDLLAEIASLKGQLALAERRAG